MSTVTDFSFLDRPISEKPTISHLEHGWGGEGEMGDKNPSGQLVSEVSEAVREMVGELVNGQPGLPVDNQGLWNSHSSNSYCIVLPKHKALYLTDPVHCNADKTYSGSTIATNTRQRGSNILAITPTPRSGGRGTGQDGVWGYLCWSQLDLIMCVDFNQSPFTFPINNVHLLQKAGLLAKPSANCDV